MTQPVYIVMIVAVLLVTLLGTATPVAAADAGSDTMAANASEEPLDLSKTTVGLVEDVVADTEQILNNGITL